MGTIEKLLAQYPATISTIAAAATVAAVIVALYLAQRQSRSRLYVFVDVNRYISSEMQRLPTINVEDASRIISVTISNVGQVAVSISYWGSFAWSVPGGKIATIQNPKEPDFRRQPIELPPGKSTTIVLTDDLSAYRNMMGNLASKSRLGSWSLRFPRLTIRTEIGDRFRAKIGKSLRQFTLEGC